MYTFESFYFRYFSLFFLSYSPTLSRTLRNVSIFPDIKIGSRQRALPMTYNNMIFLDIFQSMHVYVYLERRAHRCSLFYPTHLSKLKKKAFKIISWMCDVNNWRNGGGEEGVAFYGRLNIHAKNQFADTHPKAQCVQVRGLAPVKLYTFCILYRGWKLEQIRPIQLFCPFWSNFIVFWTSEQIPIWYTFIWLYARMQIMFFIFELLGVTFLAG